MLDSVGTSADIRSRRRAFPFDALIHLPGIRRGALAKLKDEVWGMSAKRRFGAWHKNMLRLLRLPGPFLIFSLPKVRFKWKGATLLHMSIHIDSKTITRL